MGFLKPNNAFVEIGVEVDDVEENNRCTKTLDLFGWEGRYTRNLCDFIRTGEMNAESIYE